MVAAAARTPFEAAPARVRARARRHDERRGGQQAAQDARGAAAYVVLLLLTDRPGEVLPTIASRCQPVRFDPLPPERARRAARGDGRRARAGGACARLALGDGERALALALGDGPALRARAEAFARAALHGRVGPTRPWRGAGAARARGARGAARRSRRALAEELSSCPRKEHRRRETEYGERARRAERRARTEALDLALQLAGLWYRDVACVAAGAPELVHHTDRPAARGGRRRARRRRRCARRVELVDDTRARLALNVAEDLALEALAFRLERTLARG